MMIRLHPVTVPATLSAATALTLFLAACGAEAPPELTISIDSAGVQIVNSDPTSSDATCTISEEPVLVIGEEEEDERHWFSYIRGMGRLSDGSVAAVDRATAEVRLYDEAGRHLRSMGRHGEGPGEFNDPFILWIAAGDTLWVGDNSPWRYNLFTAQGEFVRQVNFTPVFPYAPQAAGVLDNGYTVNPRSRSASREDFSVPDTLIVQIHDPGGQLVGSLARMPDRTSGVVSEAPDLWLFPLFQSFAEFDARGSTIVLAHGRDTELRILDDEFNLRTTGPAKTVAGSPSAPTVSSPATWPSSPAMSGNSAPTTFSSSTKPNSGSRPCTCTAWTIRIGCGEQCDHLTIPRVSDFSPHQQGG